MSTRQAHENLLSNLKLLQKLHTAQALADLLGISKATWTNRMKEPWKQFGLDDFRLLSKYCRVDFVELVNGKLRLKGD
jgi:hypothetical protein